MKHLTLLMLLAFLVSTCFAQQKKIAFEKYNVAEGLPEEYVISLIQDDKGFIWAATQNGLVKYDGYQFKVYKFTSDSSQTTKLRIRNLLGGLLLAKDGKIWMGGGSSTDLGTIASFDPVSEQFRHYHLPEKINGRRTGSSHLSHEDAQQNIWFLNLPELFENKPVAYLCRLNPKDGTIKIYPDFPMLKSMNFPIIKNIEALDSTVWMLDVQSNLKKWTPKTDSFEIVLPGDIALTTRGKTDSIRWISKAKNNRILLCGDQNLYTYDAKKQEVLKSYESSGSNSVGMFADTIMAAAEDEMGYFWLMHRGGILKRIHPESGHIQTFVYGKGQLAFPEAPESISDAFIVSHQNKNGIWFQSYESVSGKSFFLYYNLTTRNFSFYNNDFNFPNNVLPITHRLRFDFMEDRTGLLWLYTRPGMYKQSPKKRQMELYIHQLNDPGSLPSDSINYLFEDSKKRLWIGTRNGLAVYQPDTDNFGIFKHDPANSASISHNNITAILEDADGKIWVGTQNGLNQWQESTRIFRRFFYNPKEANYCLELFADKQHHLWLSVRNKGVIVLDKNTGKILKSYMPDVNNPAAPTSKQIEVIYQDSRENIWLGDRGDNQFGLYRLNQAEVGFTHYLPIPGDNNSISSNEILFIAEDGKKRLWIGTDGGLNLYDYDRKNFTRFMNSNLISAVCFTTDKQGEPWVGTYSSGGLVSVDVQKRNVTAYNETKGLLHNDLALMRNSGIATDNFGRFWLPNQRGLSVFDPESKSFVSYFEKDGFQPYSRSYISIKTSNGDIWIGSSHGLNRIVPADLLKKDTTLPSIVITQVTINDSLYSIPDGKIFKKSVAYTNNFQVKYWQKDISFDFVALHYLRPEDNQYSWKLENYDKDWSVPSKERKASYTNLSHGDYVFRVKASNADGVWNEEGISITMTILPPWWHTWWAYVVYALLFIAALRSYSIWRERNLRLEKEHLQVKVDERTSELKKSLEDLKSAETQLIQSEKMASLGELTAGIAHEIQNPLNFVNNFSEVNSELIQEMKEEIEKGNLEEIKALANDIADNEQKINHHGKRADAIVKGMLQHSRSSNGHREPTDINKLADEYLRLAFHGLKAKDKSFNSEFKTDFDPTLPKINVIPQDIGRVLLNLINNAFYAVHAETQNSASLQQTPQKQPDYSPTVIVSSKNMASHVEIRVLDNGPGIPPEIIDKIFQPFFTTKPTGQGTGLGLSLAYDIVKAHGGELKVETKEGVGSEFTVVLSA